MVFNSAPNFLDCIGVKWENLRKHLNPTFKWLEEIEKVVGEHHSLEQVSVLKLSGE